jgi:hypothetical protein
MSYGDFKTIEFSKEKTRCVTAAGLKFSPWRGLNHLRQIRS